MIKTNNPFDKKAREWDINPVMRDRNRAIEEAIRRLIPLRNTMDALDYGAGTGLLSGGLCGSLKSILAVDTSDGMLETIAEKVRQGGDAYANIITLKHDLSHSSLEGKSFDLIYSAMTMHHVEDVPAVLDRFCSMLRPGGYLAIADLEKEDGSFHKAMGPIPHHGFDPAELGRTIEKAGLTSVVFERVYVLTRERDGSKREYPIFLLVGRKA